MVTSSERAAMLRAVDLARTPGVPHHPNPRVGCVLLSRDGSVVGEGYHRGAGSAHAEVDALTAAGERSRGATAVVTLEPCDHHGRTGPCSVALIDAGVARVVVGQHDPNPLAAGGLHTLAAVGVDVQTLPLEEVRALNPAWTFAQRHRRPYVTWKYAATLDGRSAAADGSSRWITSSAARQDVHRLRARCDAILVGTGTVVADDPHLGVRGGIPQPAGGPPLRVVMGTRDLAADRRVLDSSAPTLRLRTRDPAAALATLFHEHDRHHVLLEGGPRLAAAFLRAGLIDEVVGYLGAALLGAGQAAVGDLGIGTIGDALRLLTTDVAVLGAGDQTTVRITGTPWRQPAADEED